MLNLFTECFYVTVLWTKWIWLWNFFCVPRIHLASGSLRGIRMLLEVCLHRALLLQWI